jgi:hypothetical protein
VDLFMSTSEYVVPTAAPGNGWDRGPQTNVAVELKRLEARREAVLEKLHRALSKRTVGNNRTALKRGEYIARRVAEHNALGFKILQIELLP